MENEHQRAIDKSVDVIFERADARKKAGRNFFETDWQASLEMTFFMVDKHLTERPGEMLPMRIDDQEEWEFYFGVLEKLDLPPETCAVFMTPSAFKNMPLPEMEELDTNDLPVERDSYTVIISFGTTQ